MTEVASCAGRTLGHPAVESMAMGMWRSRLRILAFHGVPDPRPFASQMRHIADSYTVIDQETAVAIGTGEAAVPTNAVWITFDDGYRDVIHHAQPILDGLGLRATMFVCPGLIGTREPFWWDVVSAAVDLGVPIDVTGRSFHDPSAVKHLKFIPDEARRKVIMDLQRRIIQQAGMPVERQQLTEGELAEWHSAGHSIENHTWDHPCLDMCLPAEQRRQVRAAHEWLEARWPSEARVFAYPNGNVGRSAEVALQECGYRLGLKFDHSLVWKSQPPLQWSRLRIDSDAPIERFRAIVSGAHSATFAALRCLRR